jgi:hypothetical protein
MSDMTHSCAVIVVVLSFWICQQKKFSLNSFPNQQVHSSTNPPSPPSSPRPFIVRKLQTHTRVGYTIVEHPTPNPARNLPRKRTPKGCYERIEKQVHDKIIEVGKSHKGLNAKDNIRLKNFIGHLIRFVYEGMWNGDFGVPKDCDISAKLEKMDDCYVMD